MRITGATALIKMLEGQGVEVIFGYPGAANAPIYDELSRSNIKHILPRGEQAAAHEASGYARISGKVGVCMATSGPGATNLITGIATAYMDSVSMVAITGQVASNMIGRDVFQEVDIMGATEPFCKHSYLVRDVNDLPRIIKEAFHIASTGRKGPVLIDIPIDITTKEFEFVEPGDVDVRGYKPIIKGNSLQISKLCEAIEKSKSPVIVAGGGVGGAGAEKLLSQFANKYQIPVVTTLMGINYTAHCGDMLMGMLGTHGVVAANHAVKKSDLMIVIGARLGDRAYMLLHSQDPNATVVHIDIDPAEIGKNVGTNIPIVGDVKNVLEQIMSKEIHCDIESNKEWISGIKELRDKPKTLKTYTDSANPKLALKILTELTNGSAILTTEVGQNQIWAANNYKLSENGDFLTSGGLGTMGYGLPAAIGAKEAAPHRTVIAVEGDGSFQMSLNELATIKQWNLPVKIIVFNNGRLGMVRELQKNGFHSNYFAVYLDGSPDFVKLAAAYDIEASRVSSDSDLRQSLITMLDGDRPYLLEIMVDSEENTL